MLPTGTISSESIGNAVWSHADALQLLSNVDFISNIEGGKWSIESNQMVFYEDDNVTEIARFNLFDKNGNPAVDNIYKRTRV